MSLRELWDTVVLRDILGYIFPGCITLLAVSLLLWDLNVADVWKALGTCHNKGLAGLALLPVHEPWMLLVIAPLAYAVGHLQSWIADIFEDKFPCSNLRRLALQYLMDKEKRRTYDYCGAALRKLGVPPGKLLAKTEGTPLGDWIKEAKDGQPNPGTAPLCEEQRKEEAARNQAYELWRLCDYYLIARAAEIHSMYAGRYYVLTVLFTNLGLSSIVLGLAFLRRMLPSSSLCAFVGLPLLLLLPAVLLRCHSASLSALDERPFPWWYALICYVFAILALIALIALSGQHPEVSAAWIPIVLGLVCFGRSISYRKNFVERVFPIFYAVTQAKDAQGVLE